MKLIRSKFRVQIHINLPNELIEFVKIKCEKENRSLTNYIEYLIMQEKLKDDYRKVI